VPYALLGLLCGGVSIFFSLCMRTVEDRALPWSRLPRWFAPAVGGLATGALACLLPQVMDGQYRFIQNAMDGHLFANESQINWWWWAGVFGSVALVKCIATGLTVGSGGSGGVLGPSVFVGGAVGAFLGALCEAVYPGTFPEGLREALIPVGMGGVLAATMRTPMAAIVMVTEMTGSYGLIVPSMLVCIGAYVVGRGWGLNREQVRGAAESPAHAGDLIVHTLQSRRVEELLERDRAITVAPDTPLADLVKQIQFGSWPVFAVVRDERFLGLISSSDIQRIMDEPALAEAVIAADMMREPHALLYPDENVYQALNEFRHGQDGVLPVVARGSGRRWLGALTREGVFKAVRDQIEKMQQATMREHRGLAAIGQEGQLQELLAGFVSHQQHKVQRLLVPLQAVGRSLREADFRKHFGAQVIGIEQADGSIQCPPDIDAPLRTEQRIVALLRVEGPQDSQADPPAGGAMSPP
jgi:CIC family chloride channel protein